MRVVKEARGIYRVPEPKILAGSNYADIGFDYDVDHGHVVAMCAIDNLMKGAAGTAVQCLNLMHGWDETLGLDVPGAASDMSEQVGSGARPHHALPLRGRELWFPLPEGKG